MSELKVYTADEIWAGREYNPKAIAMLTEFVNKKDYDQLQSAHDDEIERLECDVDHLTRARDALKAENERLEYERKIAQGNVTRQMDCRAIAERELQSLRSKMDKTQRVWVAKDIFPIDDFVCVYSSKRLAEADSGYECIEVLLMEVEEK